MTKIKLLVKVKVQNISDIITNSSSEMFVIKNELGPIKLVKELIETYAENHYYWNQPNIVDNDDAPDYYELPWKEQIKYDGSGGMGGEIDIQEYDLHIDYDREVKYCGYISMEDYIKKYFPTVPESDFDKFVLIDIDRERLATIDFIAKTFECYNIDVQKSWMIQDKETKKIIGVDENFRD